MASLDDIFASVPNQNKSLNDIFANVPDLTPKPPPLLGKIMQATGADFTSQLGQDALQAIIDYAKGAQSGSQELAKENTQLGQVAQLPQTQMMADPAVMAASGLEQVKQDFQPQPGYTPNDVAFQRSQSEKAAQALGRETIEPAAMIGGAALVPELAIPAMVANQAYEGYQQVGAGEALRQATIGPLQDMYNDPNLRQEMRQNPARTMANAGLAIGQALLPLEGIRRGVKSAKETAAKAPQALDEIFKDIQPEMAPQGLDAIDNSTAPEAQFKQPTQAEAIAGPDQSLTTVLQNIAAKKFDEAAQKSATGQTDLITRELDQRTPEQIARDEKWNNYADRAEKGQLDYIRGANGELIPTYGMAMEVPEALKEHISQRPVEALKKENVDIFNKINDNSLLLAEKDNLRQKFEANQEAINAQSEPTGKSKQPGVNGLIENLKNALGNERGSMSIDKLGDSLPHLIDLGKQVLSEGFSTVKEWGGRMKQYLGDMWDTYKGHLSNVWDYVKNEVGGAGSPEAIKQAAIERQAKLDQRLKEMYPKENITKATATAIANKGKTFGTGFKEAALGIKNLFSPASADQYSRRGSEILRSAMGDVNVQRIQDEKALINARNQFDKLPKSEQVRISVNMQKPNYKFSGPKAELVQAIRDAYKPVGEELVKRGFLDASSDFYHGQLWENTAENKAKIAAYQGDRKGVAKGFLEEKAIPNYEIGITEVGLKPKYTNPIDVAFQRLGQEKMFLGLQNFLEELDSNSMLKTGEKPAGWVQVPNTLTSVYGGKWYVPESVGRIINNTLSFGLRDMKGMGPAYRGWMKLGNLMNQFELAGGFHSGFTSAETMVTRSSLAVKYGELAAKAISKGDTSAAGRAIVKAASNLGNVPTAFVTSYREGSKLLAKLKDPKFNDDPIIQLYKMGGGRVKLDNILLTDFRRALKIAWAEKNPVGVVYNGVFASLEKTMSYIIEDLVPKQKLGAFAKMAEYEFTKNPNLLQDRAKAQKVAASLVDSVDNRLGQLNYDNLHLNNKLKDTMMGGIRAPGWMIGTIRELLGGVMDTVGSYKRAKAGEDVITHRMAYAMALPLTAAMLNAVGQKIAIGQWPQDIKDAMFFRNGLKDAHGVEQRSTFPTYMKDVYHWMTSPVTTAGNKIHPLLAALAQLIRNKDYYGVQIHDKNDSLLKQVGDIGTFAAKQFLPFSYTAGKKNYDEGAGIGKILLPQLGITPAPGDINKTKAEQTMQDIFNEKRKSGAMSQEEFNQLQLKRQLSQGVKNQGGGITPEVKSSLGSGQITVQQAKDIVNTKGLNSLQHGLEHMGVNDAMQVWNQASDSEKTSLKPMLMLKIVNSKSLSPTEKTALLNKVKG